MKFNPTVPFKVYSKESVYVAGQGNATVWQLVESIIKPAEGETPAEKVGVFYCEWKGGYGEQSLTAQSIGVNEMATIRTFYNPALIAAFQGKQCVIIKNTDAPSIAGGVPNPKSPYTFQLWGGVDNVMEQNQFMEFRVRRYEGK